MNIILSKGRIQSKKLTTLMKEVNPALLAVLVDGLDPNATLTGAAVAVDPEKAQAENAAEEARKHFSRIPKGLMGGGVEALRDLRDKIGDLADEDSPDLPTIRKHLATMEKAVRKLSDPSSLPSLSERKEAAGKLLAKANASFDSLPEEMSGPGIQTLKNILDKIEELAKADVPNIDTIVKITDGLLKGIQKLTGDASTDGEKPEDPSLKEKSDRLWNKVMERFDRIKALITDDERAELRKIWGLADKAREAGKSANVTNVLVALDKKILEFAKLAMADKEKAKAGATQTPATGSEAERLTAVIEKKVAWVRKAEGLVTQERGKLEKIRFAILKIKENEGDPTALLKDFDTAEKRLDSVHEALTEQRRQHSELLTRLEAASRVDPNLKRIAEAAEADLTKLDTLFDDIPMEAAKAQIQETLEEMGAAVEWREKRLKEEIRDGKHGMGRHGPQTGLEAQGVRAATTEAYYDTSDPNAAKHKVKNRGGVAPDSTSNPAGTAQRSVERNPDGSAKNTTVKWNAIDITYAEEDGKRVIVDVDKTAKGIVATASNTGASQVGSMWATPVLEKRAFDIFNKIAKDVEKYQEYKKKTGTGYNDFKSLEITLGIAESGGAGWGYAVKKVGKKSEHLDEPTAKGFLHDFQDGNISLDELFKKLQVKMM